MKKIVNPSACGLYAAPLNARMLAFFLSLWVIAPAGLAQNSGLSLGDSLKSPHPSAILELFSTGKGFLLPRMTTAERDSISNPAVGLIVYDTDLGNLFYYHDGWNQAGRELWRVENDFMINKGANHVLLGDSARTAQLLAILDTSDMRSNVLTIADSGRGAIHSFSRMDVPITDGLMPHTFQAELHNPGPFSANVIVNTDISGNSDTANAGGLMSFIESDATFTFGIGSQAYYTGSASGGDPPFVIGIYSDTYIEDHNAEAVAIGGIFNSSSEHGGANIGTIVSASDPNTLINIGIIGIVNGGEEFFTVFEQPILDTISSRVTASAFLYNVDSNILDYNLFAAGGTKSYFGGRVGINKPLPVAQLDVGGAINADWFLKDGDTLALGAWSQNGNDLFYNNGNVGVGIDTPELALEVVGGMAVASNATGSYPFSVLTVQNNTFAVTMLDTIGTDTLTQTMAMAREDGTGVISMASHLGHSTSALYITSDDSDYGTFILAVDSMESAGLVSVKTDRVAITVQSDTDASIIEAQTDHLRLASDSIQVTGKLHLTGAFFPPKFTATQASNLTGVDGMMIYVTSTNGTFTTIGFWGYENGAWVDL